MTKAPFATSTTQEQTHDAVPTSPISRRLTENQGDLGQPAADGGSVGWRGPKARSLVLGMRSKRDRAGLTLQHNSARGGAWSGTGGNL